MKKTIAITGGIASGKSTVAKMFMDLGAAIIDADPLAHRIYASGTPVFAELLEHYGPSIMNRKGEIDREALAQKVFKDPNEKAWLEARVHPATRELIRDKVTKAQAAGVPLVLVEAALHIESGYYQDFDGLIVVHADPKAQLQRLMKHRGLSEAEAQSRLDSQMPSAEKKKFGDWIIENNGSLEDTRDQVKKIFKELSQ